MTILSQSQVYSQAQKALMILGGAGMALALLLAIFFYARYVRPSLKHLVPLAILTAVSILLALIPAVSPGLTVYYATFDNTASLADAYQEYDIIGVDGLIFTLMDKADTP